MSIMSINTEYIKREMNTLQLNDETIKELSFIKPELTLLIKNSLIEIDNLEKALELMDKYELCDVFEEINKYLKSEEYVVFNEEELMNDLYYYLKDKDKEKINILKDKVKELSEEEQIRIYKQKKIKQRRLAYDLLDILDTLDKNIVMEVLKEYEYIK